MNESHESLSDSNEDDTQYTHYTYNPYIGAHIWVRKLSTSLFEVDRIKEKLIKLRDKPSFGWFVTTKVMTTKERMKIRDLNGKPAAVSREIIIVCLLARTEMIDGENVFHPE